MWLSVLVLICASATQACSGCPEGCKCVLDNKALTSLRCSSLEFLHKLCAKDVLTIKHLDISHANLYTLDKKLRKLVNLQTLNLSHNKLTEVKHFPFRNFAKLSYLDLSNNLLKNLHGKQLPGELFELNLGHNYFKDVPEDLALLGNLTVVNISGNSFSCSREALDVRDKLLERHIKFIGRASCSGPEKFLGQSWEHADELDEFLELNSYEMQGDDPGSGSSALPTEEPEGSGSPDVFEKTHVELPTRGEGDFIFEGSGHENKTEDGSGEGSGEPLVPTSAPVEEEISTRKISDVSRPQTVVEDDPQQKTSESSHTEESNFGTTIFLIIIAICLVVLIIYAVKKKKDRRHRRYDDPEKETTAEILPKPVEKQNGNPEASPLVNGQNHEPEEEETKFNYTPVENQEAKPENGTQTDGQKTPEVVSVKVKASETPVPRTPVLVDKRRTSDGQTIQSVVNGDHQK